MDTGRRTLSLGSPALKSITCSLYTRTTLDSLLRRKTFSAKPVSSKRNISLDEDSYKDFEGFATEFISAGTPLDSADGNNLFLGQKFSDSEGGVFAGVGQFAGLADGDDSHSGT